VAAAGASSLPHKYLSRNQPALAANSKQSCIILVQAMMLFVLLAEQLVLCQQDKSSNAIAHHAALSM
jgi:hypothetical protein